MPDRYLETFFNTADLKRFASPGKLLWGVDARLEVPGVVTGRRPVDVCVDTRFADDPLTESVLRPLGELRSVVVVTEEPRTQAVLDEVSRFPEPPGAVIAIGGGSTLDFAKAVTCRRLYGTMDGVGMGELRGVQPLAGVAKPLFVALPTTAGTGADLSRYYVTYDAASKGKVHGKSWELVADWSVLDPAFVATCPDALLAGTAFDTFMHLFESLVCRGERSWFGEMLSLDGIPRVMRALDAVVRGGDRSPERYLELLYCASLAGMAISNVRTGNVHEAAGALLELTDLSHPETLSVFFAAGWRQYQAATRETGERLVGAIALAAPGLGVDSMEAVVGWWAGLFEDLGIAARVRAAVEGLGPRVDEVRGHVFKRVWSDRVWVEKESPVPLAEDDVRAFIDESLREHGLAGAG